MPTFARQYHQNAVILEAHEGFHAPVRKVGGSQQVDHAPGLVRHIAM